MKKERCLKASCLNRCTIPMSNAHCKNRMTSSAGGHGKLKLSNKTRRSCSICSLFVILYDWILYRDDMTEYNGMLYEALSKACSVLLMMFARTNTHTQAKVLGGKVLHSERAVSML